MEHNALGWITSLVVMSVLLVISWFVFRDRFNVDLLTNPVVCKQSVLAAKQVALLQYDSRVKLLLAEIDAEDQTASTPTNTSSVSTMEEVFADSNTQLVLKKLISGRIAEAVVNELADALVSVPQGASQVEVIAEKRANLAAMFDSADTWCDQVSRQLRPDQTDPASTVNAR